MATEIERKFLVTNQSFKEHANSTTIVQAYLANSNETASVRLRIAGEKAWLTIKGQTKSISRSEYEYEIPRNDAEEMLVNFCNKPHIEKIRYTLKFENKIWEIDEFLGENVGLYIAEIELSSENEIFTKPSWLGNEVSHDERYFNSNLIKNPYKNWKENQ